MCGLLSNKYLTNNGSCDQWNSANVNDEVSDQVKYELWLIFGYMVVILLPSSATNSANVNDGASDWVKYELWLIFGYRSYFPLLQLIVEQF